MHTIELEVTKSSIQRQQNNSSFDQADVAVRIKILDDDTGKYRWFTVTPRIRNNKPSLAVEVIGTAAETIRHNTTSTFRECQ